MATYLCLTMTDGMMGPMEISGPEWAAQMLGTEPDAGWERWAGKRRTVRPQPRPNQRG
jgi:hypothetical protein